MLQRIRDNASGPVAYAVVGLISLVFGVWGIGSYFTPSANPDVASVGNIKISRYQLQQNYNQRYRRLRTVMGDRFDPATFQPSRLRRTVLQNLIRSAVIDQYAVNAGYRTTDHALLQVLTSNPRFQVNGKFSTQRYKALLANAGLTADMYESRLRQSIASNQVRAGVVNSAFAAPPAVAHAYNLIKQQRKISYLLFPASAYEDQVKLTTEEVSDWYERHAKQFMRPERVKLAYVELQRSALQPPDDALTEDALRSLYKQANAQFSTPDRRDGRQIFIPVTQDNAGDARSLIQSLASKLAQGQSFDQIAADGQGSIQVTTLDSVSRSQLPDDVAAALFNTDVGQISNPVRSSKGWYVVKPTAAQPGKTKSFSAPEVQKQLKKMARTQWRNKHFSKLAERMETLAFQAPNSLKTLSTELGLEIRESDWITQAKGQGLGQSDAIRKAAFSDAVLNKGLNSTSIQLDPNYRVVLRIAAHQPPHERPLDKVRDQVRKRMRAQKGVELAQQAAEKAAKQLTKGDVTLEEVAAQTSAQVKQPGYIGRADKNVPRAIRQAVFALPEPADDKTVYDVAPTSDAGSALVALHDVKTGAVAEDEAIPPVFVKRHKAYVAQLGYAAFAAYLDNHAEVQINEEELKTQR